MPRNAVSNLYQEPASPNTRTVLCLGLTNQKKKALPVFRPYPGSMTPFSKRVIVYTAFQKITQNDFSHQKPLAFQVH